MITNVTREIMWNEVTKKVWSDQLCKNIEMKFLHFCISHNYNFEMNDNDIADQQQLQYWLMRFCCNVKWWWALWQWGFEVSLVNAYMLYCQYHEELHIKTKYNPSEFIKMCAKAYIEPVNHWPTHNHLHIRQVVNNSPKEERQQCFCLTSNSFCHLYGTVKCCHDISLSHFPQPSQKKNPTQCQLHMWAFKAAKKGQKAAMIMPNQRVHTHKLSNVPHAKLIFVLTVLLFFIELTIWKIQLMTF